MMLACLFAPASRSEAPANRPVSLTTEETQWLAQHPILKVGADPAWPPVSFYNTDGQHDGVDAGLLALLAQRLGVRFDVVRFATWADVEAAGSVGKLDLLTGMARTSEREATFLFTEPYFGAPVAVIMRDDAPFYTGLRYLHGKEVALPDNYVTTRMIERQHPAIRLRHTNTAAEALLAVSRGQADATVENLVTASHLLRSEGLTNLKIVGIAEFDFELRLAVPRDRPILRDILDKALAAISAEERFRLQDKWVPVNIEGAINWGVVKRLALWFFGTAALVVAVVVLKNRRLARELAARRAAEASLRDLHNEKNHLMAMIAHDLNNPLQILRLACDSLDASRNPETVDMLRQTVDRMSRLVKNLLNVGALEAGKSTLHLRKLDLSEVVSEVVDVSQGRARAKDIALSFSGEEGRVFADSDALAQVVDNLLGNALKFTPSGGRVALSVKRSPEGVKLRVTDSGPGIHAEEIPQLFGEFTRLSARPTAGESSHGLGLSIVKRLVAGMGGTIDVESRTGNGTTFVVCFPEATA
jgi:polar amino acid transport system substrate-binding protein